MSKGRQTKQLELELQALRRDSKQLHQTLATVIAKYQIIVEKQANATERALARVKEEERENLSNKPFVLVIIDPTGLKFCNELLDGHHMGGAEAARLLSKAVSEDLAANHPEIAATDYQLVVRLFVFLMDIAPDNASTLRLGRVSSLFFAGFTKSRPSFDWVTTGAKNEVPARVCENLRLYMGNDGCKHIFFAAAGAPRYLDALRQHHRKSAQKLTIVTGFDTGHDIRELGLPVVAFPKVFAERSAATFKFIDFNNAQAPGILKTATSLNISPTTLSDKHNNNPTVPSFLFLPMHTIQDRVPINQAKQRLDIQTLLPTPADILAYKECIRIQEPCSEFHLQGKCKSLDCKLSHDILAPGVHCVLACKAIGKPCSKGSVCRIKNCIHAHVCQQEHCAQAGIRVYGCGLPDDMHNVDPHVVEWVPADASE